MLTAAWQRAIWMLLIVWLATPGARGADPAPNATALVAEVEKQFATWDDDHNGNLSTSEIDAVVANPQTRGSAAAAVAALKRASRSSKYHLPPLSLENIKQLAATGPSADRPDLAKMYGQGLARINQADRSLFAADKPRLDTIHQGRLGNCFCLAPLGAVLNSNPDRVAAMFQRQDDGSYGIVFGSHVVSITLPTEAELSQMATNERGGLWVNLYEKALGEARNLDRPEDKRLGSPIDALARGGSAGTILSFITGHKIQRFSLSFAKDKDLSADECKAILDQLRTYLREASDAGRPMTCGTKQTTTPGLTPNHAYALLSYDAKLDVVRLWNPHGSSFAPKGPSGSEHGYPREDGVFSMPLADFIEQFSGVAVETDLPVGDQPELPKLPQRAAKADS
jgi:hypothetical protein